MSLLTDTDLNERMCSDREWKDRNRIHIYPFSEESLTPVGYDLRVGTRYVSAFKNVGYITIKAGDIIAISPGDTVLIETSEKIGMPKDRKTSALIMSKVSMVSKGLSHISTTIDPDWDGKLLITIHNHSRNDVNLKFEDPFCTAVFFENKSPSTKDCNKAPGRSDILATGLTTAAQKAQKKERIKRWVTIGITIFIPLSFGGLGYKIFGNNPGFVAMTAVGICISQVVSQIMRK